MLPWNGGFFATGILGGFTTFSAFSNETVSLLRDGQLWHAFAYIGCSVIIGLLATFSGILLLNFYKALIEVKTAYFIEEIF